MTRLPIYILAGGRSSRFGSDKARAVLDGEPLIKRVARMAMPIAESTTIVADRTGKYDDLGLRSIADDPPHLGPLGGLAAALGIAEKDGCYCCRAICSSSNRRGLIRFGRTRGSLPRRSRFDTSTGSRC